MRAPRDGITSLSRPASSTVSTYSPSAHAIVERSRVIDRLEKIITQDIGGRGLAVDPHDNLVTRCRGNLGRAARHLASDSACVAIVTGFYVAHAAQPAIETDGPCGAIALAWLLSRLGIQVTLITDPLGVSTIEAGVRAACIAPGPIAVDIFPFDGGDTAELATAKPLLDSGGGNVSIEHTEQFFRSGQGNSLTHLIAIERAGPSWSPQLTWPASDVSQFE